MPLPSKKDNESKENFISRCMNDENLINEFADLDQRLAVCMSKACDGLSMIEHASFKYACEEYGFTEEINEDNFYIPTEAEYVDVEGEETELWENTSSKAAEYQGRKVTLNKPFRTPGGPKKFAVYTKNGSGKVVIVRFGDPNMKIKKSDPARRKSFRARHKCDNPGPKWKARFWACKSWVLFLALFLAF